MNKNRILAWIFLVIVTLTAVNPVIPAAPAENVIEIRTVREFSDFSKAAELDEYTAGKTISLLNDLDFSDQEFTPVPVLCGIFEGNGHTIRGISYTKNASDIGVFRTVEANGCVQNLTVDVTVVPGGSKSNVGGLCGTNQGLVQNCTFKGSVKGASGIGGIAAVNEYSGRIFQCQSAGVVYGSHYVGGVCGKNYGMISGCGSVSLVNTRVEKVDVDFDFSSLKNLRSTENISEITDIGGIAGYSSGAILWCTNEGAVGYAHVGYNIGGIAGRQAGYVNACTNTGDISGRKDVGGIVGQMEPYTTVRYDRSSLDRIQSEIDSLQLRLNSTIQNTDVTRTAFSSQLDALLKNAREAGDTTSSLLNQTNDYLNDSIDTVNDLTGKVSGVLDGTIPLLKSMTDTTKLMKDNLDGYRDALQLTRDTIEGVDTSRLFNAMDSASLAMNDMYQAMKDLNSALNTVDNNYTNLMWLQDDLDDLKKYTIRFSESLRDCQAEILEAMDQCNKIIKDAIKHGTPKDEMADQLLRSLRGTLNAVNDELKAMYQTMERIADVLADIPSALRNLDTNGLYHALTDMMNMAADLRSATKNLENAVNQAKISREDYDAFTDDLKSAMDKVQDTSDLLGKNADQMLADVDKVISVVEEFNTPISFPKTDDEYQKTKDQLSDSIKALADRADLLHSVAQNGTGTLSSDLQGVSDQMFRLMNAVSDAANGIEDWDKDDLTEDISSEDTKNQTEGKVANSQNNGKISADVNVGGIAGSMAIEYDYDPEDDIKAQGKRSLKLTFLTKAVARGCSNYGEIEAKKNYVGGIVGRMDLGSVIESVACGKIESSSGDYVGGIAGESDTVIKKSAAKCTLSGDSYIGGIVGKGKDLFNNYSLVKLKNFDEYAGAVAGDADGMLAENYFTNEELGGVNSISYAAKTRPVSYEELIALPEVPDIFRTFTLTFMAEDKLVDTLTVDYGASLSEEELPKIPARENCYGKWDTEDFTNIKADMTVEAVYDDYITSIESKVQAENGLPLILAEGEFSEKSEIVLSECDEKELKKSGMKHVISAWNCEVTDNDRADTTIHYAVPREYKNPKVYVKKDGEWKKCSAEYDGSYLVFHQDRDAEAFCISRAFPIKQAVLAIVLLTLLCLAAVFGKKMKAYIPKKG